MKQSHTSFHVWWFDEGELVEDKPVREGWYFFDEVGGLGGGPFSSEAAAIYSLNRYVEQLNISDPMFPLGQCLVTIGAAAAISPMIQFTFLQRHVRGDWGEVDDEDKKANEDALKTGGRVLSSYEYAGVKVWVITEGDRSVTTVLLPDEY